MGCWMLWRAIISFSQDISMIVQNMVLTKSHLTVPWKRTGSCGITATDDRSWWRPRLLMSTPSTRMQPDSSSWSLIKETRIEDLPVGQALPPSPMRFFKVPTDWGPNAGTGWELSVFVYKASIYQEAAFLSRGFRFCRVLIFARMHKQSLVIDINW